MSSYRLRLDPWTSEFEGPVQLGEEPAGRVDLAVEVAAWGAIRPPDAPSPGGPRSSTGCGASSCGC